MTAYKEGIRTRILAAWAGAAGLLVVALVAIFALELSPTDEHTQGFIRGAQAGLFLVLLAKAVLTALQYSRAMRDEALLKKLFIAETDERSRLIRDKIGNVGLNLLLGLLAVASLVAAYFDTMVFYTLFAATAVGAVVKAGLKLYFRHKY